MLKVPILDGPNTGVDNSTVCELQAPVTPGVAPGKAPSQHHAAGRQDSFVMVGN
jgi:hypothetical protein